MSIFRDFFVKEKPVFTGIARGAGGFGFGAGDQEVPQGSASGGTKTVIGTTNYHAFTTNQNLVVTGTLRDCEVLAVGGGGGCGYDVGGGGGGGGLVHFSSLIFKEGTFGVVIGGGGSSPGEPNVRGVPGGNTTIVVSTPLGTPTTITAAGGGGGGTYPSNGTGSPGGSGGGGGAAPNQIGGTGTQPGLNPGVNFGGFTQYGNSGGRSAPSAHGSGGGGGSGGAGADGVTDQPVLGGTGKVYDISGTSYMYASGGYGQQDGGPIRPPNEFVNGSPKNGNPAGSGNGANGAGSGSTYPGGAGGIVIIKYPST